MMKMILVDSLYVNTGGAKVLLDYLVDELEKSGIEVFYLFDARCTGSFQNVKKDNKQYLEASLLNRFLFYARNSHRFSSIFCFGNLPPLTNQKVGVITYFHQKLYIGDIEKSQSLKKKLILGLKRKILSSIRKNTDLWLVQQESIKDGLINTYHIENSSIMVLPFYPPVPSNGIEYRRDENSFLYVSLGSQHKNHNLLLDAFCTFYDIYGIGKLTLTIPDKYRTLFDLIESRIKQGYPIINVGYLPHDKMYELYQIHEYLVFPSKAESFGLGIVEGIENGCKVIGSDLPYMHAVCQPSLTFNPNSKKELIECFRLATTTEIPDSKSKVKNEIGELLDIFRNQAESDT